LKWAEKMDKKMVGRKKNKMDKMLAEMRGKQTVVMTVVLWVVMMVAL
jgi:hypothetical protein